MMTLTIERGMPLDAFHAAVNAASLYAGHELPDGDYEPQTSGESQTGTPSEGQKRRRRTKAEMEAARAAEQAAGAQHVTAATAPAVTTATTIDAQPSVAVTAAPTFTAPADANSLFGGFAPVAAPVQATEPPATLVDIQTLVQKALGIDAAAATPKLQAAFAKFGANGFSTLKPEMLDPMRAEVRAVIEILGAK